MGLDDPATTSAVVYKIQVSAQNSGAPFSLNRAPANVNDAAIYHATSMTSLILMEVSA